jgi:hypothetical protein
MKSLNLKKSVFALAALAVSLVSSGSAHAFMITGNAVVSSSVVEATFCNYSYEMAVSCRVRAIGMSNAGMPVYAYVNMVLFPGQCDYAYVYAIYPNYFINGAGDGYCQFGY